MNWLIFGIKSDQIRNKEHEITFVPYPSETIMYEWYCVSHAMPNPWHTPNHTSSLENQK